MGKAKPKSLDDGISRATNLFTLSLLLALSLGGGESDNYNRK